MMYGAIYNAVNSIVPLFQPYRFSVPAPSTASLDAAVAYAAHDTLAAAFSHSTFDLSAALQKALSTLPPGTSVGDIAAGKWVGQEAARAMVQDRANDGSNNNTPYINGTNPGEWRPTGSGEAASPNWPSVRPFCINIGAQFRLWRPGGYASRTEMLQSREYAAQVNEVQALGRYDSAVRTEEQTEIAFFWANDLDGTYKAPGHLYDITKAVSARRNLDIVQNARMFALVGLTVADAALTAWDQKYATDLDLWRPETAIREADSDGNPDTEQDECWEPLSQDRDGAHFSPPFPGYISGHSTMSAAYAGLMREHLGTDNVTFTATTDDPHAHGVTRPFNSFLQLALESLSSRVYLGVNFRWDAENGFLAGTGLGRFVFTNFLRPLTA